ncbi:MAG: Maf family protein [Firmicutes bacterium]|nr:Maf family protein [Bacillota bacterium]
MKKLILASKSPRRSELLKKAGYDPIVMPASVEENIPFEMTPETATMYLAFCKAMAVSQSCDTCDNLPVLAADTVVVHKGKIIGKPEDRNHALEILKALRNDTHSVITGCCIIHRGIKRCFYDETLVFFGDYSDESLEAYVDTDEPYDKAGAYAIQGTFGKYTDHIKGDLDNVIGLPVHLVKKFL